MFEYSLMECVTTALPFEYMQNKFATLGVPPSMPPAAVVIYMLEKGPSHQVYYNLLPVSSQCTTLEMEFRVSPDPVPQYNSGSNCSFAYWPVVT